MSTVEVQHIKSDGHEVIFGRHSPAQLAEHLSTEAFSGVKLFILVDQNTLKNCLPVLIGKVSRLQKAEIIEIAAGESNKCIEICTQLWNVLGDLGADRSSVLINLGGGVVSDIGGFVAGTFKRGIRFFNVPTTLLAQVDASLGGKTGVNNGVIKNEIGIFNNPNGVFVDPSLLHTLPQKELLSGFAEMVKHALICDSQYWKELKDVSLLNLENLDPAILRSIHIKNEIVTSDPYESGRRKILNFGHTIGHAIESFSLEGDSRALLHGEAVAMGMVCESYISHKAGLLTAEELHEIAAFIFSYYSRVRIEEMTFHRIIELMRHDKKNRNGQLKMTLLHGIGNAVTDREVKADTVIDALNFYTRWVA